VARAERGSKAHRSGAGRKEHWQTEPDEHDYPAAADYLSLLAPQGEVARLVDRLREAPIVWRKAKDLFRASRLPLLGPDNPHVAEDLDKVRRGQRLSPVLVVRGDLTTDVPLTVADGYHRICASYHLDENAEVPCRLADLPRPDRDRSGPAGADSAGRPRPVAPGS
jgi:hypothetical protein